MLTSDEYAQINGVECPVCESTDLDTQPAKVYGPVVKQAVNCKDCGSTWQDVLILSGFEQLENRSNE